MTTVATKQERNLTQVGPNRKWFRLGRFTLGLLAVAVILVLCARWLLFAPPALQAGDLLLLEPESVGRVEAAAEAGDVMAQSALGSAYLQGRAELPRDVTKAVYWLRKVADRDRSEFERISSRMQSLLEKRQREFDLRKRRAIELEYLDLAGRKLAFEAAFLGLVGVYLGRYGGSYADSELARKYLRRGAAYGFASAQRTLGIVTQFGLLGVRQNDIEAAILLSEAAAKGDRVAQELLYDFQSYHDLLSDARIERPPSNASFW